MSSILLRKLLINKEALTQGLKDIQVQIDAEVLKQSLEGAKVLNFELHKHNLKRAMVGGELLDFLRSQNFIKEA